MSEIHFNVKDIKYIELTPVKQQNYKWYEEKPVKRFFFDLIVDEKGIKEGWAKSEFEREYCDYDNDWWYERLSKKTLENRHMFFVGENENGKQWFSKAKVYISKIDDSHYNYFESNDEANAWIEKVKKASKEKFEIIYKD